MIPTSPLKHLAIIMDGNGRWAEQKDLSRFEGHVKGSESVELVIEQCLKYKISHLTLFAFSTENWGRPTKEVNFLMELLENHIITKSEKFISENIRLETIGNLSKLPQPLQSHLKEIKLKTKSNTALTVIFALNYGGRDEIKNAALKLAADIEQNRISKFNFTNNDFSKYLETSKWPDPDLIIRTSGEQRISNFLLWQSAYSEFYFTDRLWPDFKEQDFLLALKDYYDRHRKFGCLDENSLTKKSTETQGLTNLHDIRKKQTPFQ